MNVLFIAMVTNTIINGCGYEFFVGTGSFSSATCLNCKHKVNIDVIKEEIMKEVSHDNHNINVFITLLGDTIL